MLYVFGTRRLGSVCARVQRLCRRAAAPQRTAHKLGFTVRRNPAPRAPPSQSNLKPSAAAPAMKVLVVGAGFAGLAAARRLQAKGWDVCILEGSHRVGGRAQTTEASQSTGLERMRTLMRRIALTAIACLCSCLAADR